MFRWVWAISMRTGPLKAAIDRYKVEGKIGWASIFGRVLLGYLDANDAIFSNYDLIIPSPTWVGDGGRAFDHTGLVLERAASEGVGRWPFEIGVVRRPLRPRRFEGGDWKRRYEIAESELRPALVVPEPEKVQGKRVLVYDDVYTEGLTLRAVARCDGSGT